MDVQTGKSRAVAGINVTPLVDIVLVLLIIFMVLTPNLMKHHTVKVPPESKNPEPGPTPIVVEYSADRHIQVNAKPVEWEGYAAEMAQRLKKTRSRTVFFKVESDANYSEVVRLMDTARGAGATTLAMVP